ncbi:M20 metallopeptidase family protein [Alkalihalobacillus deserti]|uniref:M20 metallopeptidase family protein n=1 Tax=Alkalihalobacillus deserti TaxID=2879466 RepID=UPI001D1531EC|nr:M20 family metallopeptidase [Alkalihalobacillus deserti]
MVSIDKLITWRRHLHREPELSFQEIKTTTYIIEQLQGLPGVRLQSGIDQIGVDTGVLAIVGNGTGPIVGLRADIDALPITEKTGVSYQSCKQGVMHACGHDGHSAMLLGAVHTLSNLYQSGKLKGTVKCLFQPAEEAEDDQGKTGAQYVLEKGVLADVEAIIALHLDPEIPLGKVKLKSGPVMANVDTFKLTISGTGGHGAYPEQTVDPIWLSSFILPYLYSLPSRKLAALEPTVLSICQISGGASTNVIPSEVTLRGTMRTYSEEARVQLVNELNRGLKTIIELGGAYDLHVHQGEPALLNDDELTQMMEEVLHEVEPNCFILYESFGMGGEDFSHITRKIPGVMLFLGAQAETKTSLHQPTFNFDELAMDFGLRTLVEGALRMIKRRREPDGS